MQQLMLGIGGFGSNIINYMIDKDIKLTEKNHYDFALIDNDFQILNGSTCKNKILTDDHLVFKAGTGLCESINDMKTLISKYDKIICFVGVGGTFGANTLGVMATETLYELQNKFYIVCVTPFSFEGRLKAERANEILKTIIDNNVPCGIFANSEPIGMTSGVSTLMNDFNNRIISSIPW